MIGTLFAALTRLFTGGHPVWLGTAPSRTQRIYFANHTSNLDFVLLWAVLPGMLRAVTRPLGARDYWEASGIRRFLAKRVFHAILIERKNVTKSNNPLIQIREALARGESLIIFPEGGRSFDGELKPFKSGLYHAARFREDVELIPVYIQNLNRVLPKGEVLPIPMICSVTFGLPIRPEPDEKKDAFLERARQAIEILRKP